MPRCRSCWLVLIAQKQNSRHPTNTSHNRKVVEHLLEKSSETAHIEA
jgi:hypothetical protein